MSSNQLSGKEQEEKFASVKTKLTEVRRADIKRDIRNFVMHQAVDGSNMSQMDIAFHVDKIPIIIESLRELATELEERRSEL